MPAPADGPRNQPGAVTNSADYSIRVIADVSDPIIVRRANNCYTTTCGLQGNYVPMLLKKLSIKRGTRPARKYATAFGLILGSCRVFNISICRRHPNTYARRRA